MGAQVADKDTDQLPLGGHHSAIIQSFRQSSLGPLPRLGSTAFPGLFEPPGVRAAPSGVGWNSPHPGFCRGGAGRGAVAGQAVGSQLAAPQTGRWDPRPRWRAEVDTESPADLPTSSLRGQAGVQVHGGNTPMPGSTPAQGTVSAHSPALVSGPRPQRKSTEMGGGPDRAVGSDPGVLLYCHHPQGGTQVLD